MCVCISIQTICTKTNLRKCYTGVHAVDALMYVCMHATWWFINSCWRQIYRQRDRMRDRQTARQTSRQTDTGGLIPLKGLFDTKSSTITACIHTHTQRDILTYIHTYIHTYKHTSSSHLYCRTRIFSAGLFPLKGLFDIRSSTIRACIHTHTHTHKDDKSIHTYIHTSSSHLYCRTRIFSAGLLPLKGFFDKRSSTSLLLSNIFRAKCTSQGWYW